VPRIPNNAVNFTDYHDHSILFAYHNLEKIKSLQSNGKNVRKKLNCNEAVNILCILDFWWRRRATLHVSIINDKILIAIYAPRALQR
jgi:hypothetical protein